MQRIKIYEKNINQEDYMSNHKISCNYSNYHNRDSKSVTKR